MSALRRMANAAERTRFVPGHGRVTVELGLNSWPAGLRTGSLRVAEAGAGRSASVPRGRAALLRPTGGLPGPGLGGRSRVWGGCRWRSRRRRSRPPPHPRECAGRGASACASRRSRACRWRHWPASSERADGRARRAGHAGSGRSSSGGFRHSRARRRSKCAKPSKSKHRPSWRCLPGAISCPLARHRRSDSRTESAARRGQRGGSTAAIAVRRLRCTAPTNEATGRGRIRASVGCVKVCVCASGLCACSNSPPCAGERGRPLPDKLRPLWQRMQARVRPHPPQMPGPDSTLARIARRTTTGGQTFDSA